MNQDKDEKAMLAFLGIDSVERLFDDIPQSVRTDLDGLAKGLNEFSAKRKVESILASNKSSGDMPSFLGAGVYDFYVPAAVTSVASRSEFVTSYTPYQPELSQGLLQTLFEYQSMMSSLTGMDVVNNSIYDHSTALGEAVLMAARLKEGGIFLVPKAMAQSRLCVVENYCKGAGIEIRQYGYEESTGAADVEDLKANISDDVIGAYVETPNVFGVMETELDTIRQMLDSRILVTGVNLLALAVTTPPGDYEADIAVAEGQMFGSGVNFGGPLLGVFCCKKEYIRKMPGRVVGMTNDVNGRRAFCMTLQTREQHIRREKATSNICSNEALTTVATAAYMAMQGGGGLRNLAISVMEKRNTLVQGLNQVMGCSAPRFKGAHFNEFVIELPGNAEDIAKQLAKKGVLAGVPLSYLVDGLDNCLLVSVTDKTTKNDVNALVAALKEVCR